MRATHSAPRAKIRFFTTALSRIRGFLRTPTTRHWFAGIAITGRIQINSELSPNGWAVSGVLNSMGHGFDGFDPGS